MGLSSSQSKTLVPVSNAKSLDSGQPEIIDELNGNFVSRFQVLKDLCLNQTMLIRVGKPYSQRLTINLTVLL